MGVLTFPGKVGINNALARFAPDGFPREDWQREWTASPPRVVAIGDLAQIEREILSADVVELACDCPLEDRPHTFDCVGVDRPENDNPPAKRLSRTRRRVLTSIQQ